MKPSVVQGVKLQEFKKILVSNMVMSRKMILTQGYELPLNAFKIFSVNGRYRVPQQQQQQ
jgi:hypothetical protein